MKLGISLLLWTPRVTTALYPLFARLRELGYDGVEVPINEGNDGEYTELRAVLDDAGLERTAVTFATADTNPIADTAAAREAATAHLRRMVDRAADLGCRVAGGPIHSAYAEFVGRGPTEDERTRCAEVLRVAGEHAASRGVTLGVEFLNRFECYFLTTAADTAELVRRVDHANVRMVYDTHHAHIEEDDVSASLVACADVIAHVQLSESHRGVPGRGQVAWDSTFAALRDIGYDGWLVIESFSRFDPEFGANLRIWRDFAQQPMDIARAGAAFVRGRWP